MGRWTGSWLSGPGSAGLRPAPAGDGYRGERLGRPASGAGSVSGFGPRLGAFAIDTVLANLLVGLVVLFGVRPGPGLRGELVLVAFLLQELVLVASAGATAGMRLAGVRVARVADGGQPGFAAVLLRTLLLSLLVPALIWDADGRGMHDRASGTVVVRG